MAHRIALFNHKGGVSKTTTTFNLGWMLAEKGKRVIIVDTDPQCNLTGMVLGLRNQDDLDNFYRDHPDRNIYSQLLPVFESGITPLKPVECIEVEGNKNLLMLPGHINFSEYDVTLGIAQELSSSISALRNIPGSISHLIEITAEHHNADYVLIDMSPSLSAINHNLLMSSHYFIIPTNPDVYSTMAISSLSRVIRRWCDWTEKVSQLKVYQDAIYPFPSFNLKFLGAIIQKYRLRMGKPTTGFGKWFDEIKKALKDKLIPVLSEKKMLLDKAIYSEAGIKDDYILSEIPDFNTLIACSQEESTLVFALTDAQIEHVGIVLKNLRKNVEEYRKIFNSISDSIIRMIE
ncbi:AAA family ATPase [bacterium]|nr:AAA family ATPase [bacterium]